MPALPHDRTLDQLTSEEDQIKNPKGDSNAQVHSSGDGGDDVPGDASSGRQGRLVILRSPIQFLDSADGRPKMAVSIILVPRTIDS